MARPSGTCNGQNCYTAADLAEINAELANAIAERDDLLAQAAVWGTTIGQLEQEQRAATMNACP